MITCPRCSKEPFNVSGFWHCPDHGAIPGQPAGPMPNGQLGGLTFYTLDGKTPVPCNDYLQFGQLLADVDKRRVADSVVGTYRISTVFIGIDPHMRPGKQADLFETAVMDEQGAILDMARCPTWDEAEKQHQMYVARYKAKAK